MEERVDYEFRTTVVPELVKEDIYRIADRIKGARLYIMQQFRRPSGEEVVDYRVLKTPHSSSFMADDDVKLVFCQYDPPVSSMGRGAA
jgi:hypothetical protein